MMCFLTTRKVGKVHPIAYPITCGTRKQEYKDLPVLIDRDDYEVHKYIKAKEERGEYIVPQNVTVRIKKNVNKI